MTGQTVTSRVERIKPQVWTLKAKLYVPHEEGELIFAHPCFGPGTYKAIGQQILEKIPGKDLSVPTGDRTASLLYSAYCDPAVSEEPEFQDVRQRMRSDWLWAFNRNIFTENGVYVVEDLEAKGISGFNLSELESMLTQESEGIRFDGKGLVRFAPKETYRLGEHTSESLAKDGFIRASYGFEGAKKLGEVSAIFKHCPITYGVSVKKGEYPVERVSALDGDDGRLHVGGDKFGDYGRSLAFGVLE